MVCQRCFRRLNAHEPVYRIRGRGQDPLGSLYDRRLAICADCFKKSWMGNSPEWLSEPRPCKGCGRLVIDYLSYWESTYCSESCRMDYYRAKGKKKRAEIRRTRTCASCGQSFNPKRTDMRYCSAACKQSAYRQRKVPSLSADRE